jgi:uncharacterized membrane protein
MVGSLTTRKRAILHRGLGVAFVLLAYISLSHGLVLLGVPVPHAPVPDYQPIA